MRLLGLALLISLSFTLTACGDGADANGDSNPFSAEADCTDLAGETMTDTFDGCTEDGSIQAALIYDCDDGRELVFAGSAFGYVDEPIQVADGGGDSEAGQALFAECKGLEPEADAADATPLSCDDVWVVGNTLPADYSGCEREGELTANYGLECTDGTTLYVLENIKTGDDQFYGITGQEIGEATDDSAYSEAYGKCAG